MIDRSPDFVVTDAGFVDALRRRSRRRRRRHVIVAVTSAVAVVAGASAAVSTLTFGTDSLRTPAGPGLGRTPAPAPSADHPGAVGAGSPEITRNGVAGPASLSASPAPGHSIDVVVPGRSTSTPGAAGGAADAPISSPMLLSRTDYDNTRPCSDTSGRAATGWCVQVLGPFSARSGRSTSLDISLCRLPGVGASASFSGTLEADFSLETPAPDRSQVWHYARQHPDRSRPHSYAVDAGTCLNWSTTWHVRGDAGAPVPRGNYTLVAMVRADNVSSPNQVVEEDYAFTVT